MEYANVLMSSEVVKNLLKLPRVKAPFASVNAYMAIITSGRTTNISMKMKYGRDQYDLLNVLIACLPQLSSDGCSPASR